MEVSISSRRISNVRVIPACPPTPSAQHCSRPRPTAFAPKASALHTSGPRMNPLSITTSMFGLTASTTSAKTSIVETVWSNALLQQDAAGVSETAPLRLSR